MAEKEILKQLNSIVAMLTEQKTHSNNVLTFNEAVKFLDLSPSYLYKLTSGGEIPHYKPNNKKIYFNREELETWLQRHRVKSNAEIENEASTYATLKKGKL